MLSIVDSRRSRARRLSCSTTVLSGRGASSSASIATRIAATGVRSWCDTCEENERSRRSSSRMRSPASVSAVPSVVELADARLRRRRAGVVATDRRRPLAQPLDGPAQAPGQQGADDAGDGDDADAGEAEQQDAAAHAAVALRARAR